MDEDKVHIEDETWDLLPELLDRLPQPVHLHVWADKDANQKEHEAIRLVQTLSDRFKQISHSILPRRVNYRYYPIIGVLHPGENEDIDYGVRIIGLPAGVQLTSLISAIQNVAFQGMTSEATTRIKLRKLEQNVTLELMTSAEDEAGTIMAHRIFNMAVASPFIRSFLVMVDDFPDAGIRYSVRKVPHLVINGRVHVEGLVDEQDLLTHIGRSLVIAKPSIDNE